MADPRGATFRDPGSREKRQGVRSASPQNVRVSNALFGPLHRHRRIKLNPCLGVHRPAAPSKGERVLNVKIDVRHADELRWFWKACNQIGPPFGSFCQILLLTGCRREEIARMTVDELSSDTTMLSCPVRELRMVCRTRYR